MSPNASDKVALDRVGPFDSEEEIFAWSREFRVEYRENAEVFVRAPLTWSEMTGDQASGPWFTRPYAVVG